MAKRPVSKQAVPQPSDASYRIIGLTKNQIAIVDAEDYDFLMQWGWHAHWDDTIKGYYAVANHGGPRMHNLVTGQLHVDHKNHNGLDNRRDNLRPCTHEENCRNRKLRADSKIGLKGVHWQKGSISKHDKGGWSARIQINGKRIMLGRFPSKEEAARAYDLAALCLFGEFAVTNFDYSLPNVLPTP